MYEGAPRSFGRYQVYRFTFQHEYELTRCVNEFKSFMGINKLSELDDNKVEMYVYSENTTDCLNKAEIMRLVSSEDPNKQWYPCAVGISEAPHNLQTILTY